MAPSDDVVTFETRDTESCAHLATIEPVVPSADGCEDCVRIGSQWLHLRICLRCGHVGCCDDSPNRHARAHFERDGHPIIKSFEPGETWAWCFVDDVLLRARR